MKVEMKQFEVWCGEYSKRWNKKELWEWYILVQDAYINGFKKARDEAEKSLLRKIYNVDGSVETFETLESKIVKNLGEEKVEVEVSSNQIGG